MLHPLQHCLEKNGYETYAYESKLYAGRGVLGVSASPNDLAQIFAHVAKSIFDSCKMNDSVSDGLVLLVVDALKTMVVERDCTYFTGVRYVETEQ
jgi:hypothetical protein